MIEYKVGMKVRIKLANTNHPYNNLDGIIDGITKDWVGEPLYRINTNGSGLLNFKPEQLVPLEGCCVVCNQLVGEENHLIKAHKHGELLCYGSYTPSGLMQ